MSATEQTSSDLVTRYTPWLERLVGGLFIIGGLWPFSSGERVFGSGFVLAGARIIIGFAKTVISRFDLATGGFTQVTKGLVRNKRLTHPLAEITGVRVVQSHSSADSPSRS